MKLLLDENLSRKLVPRLRDLFPGSTHVSAEGLLESPDREIWAHAKAGGYILVTADSDFYEMATTLGPPPKVIWLRGCDYPTDEAERLLRAQALRISAFVEDEELGVLTLTP